MDPRAGPDSHCGIHRTAEPELPSVSEGIQRYVWESTFGPV
jgi:hypothetical protein